MSRLRFAKVALLAVLASAAAGCGNDTATTPTPDPVRTLVDESFTASIDPGGSTFYSFTLPVSGTVSITLQSVTRAGVDVDASLVVGTGAPAGTGCNTNASVTTSAGAAPQLVNNFPAGIFCVRVADAGTLTAPVTVAVNINRPQS